MKVNMCKVVADPGFPRTANLLFWFFLKTARIKKMDLGAHVPSGPFDPPLEDTVLFLYIFWCGGTFVVTYLQLFCNALNDTDHFVLF